MRVLDEMSDTLRDEILRRVDATLWTGRREVRLSGILEARGYEQGEIVLMLLKIDGREARALVESLVGRRITVAAMRRVEPPPQRAEREPDDRRVLRVIRNTRLPATRAYSRMSLARAGMTVRQLLSRGVTRRDLRIARRRGELEMER